MIANAMVVIRSTLFILLALVWTVAMVIAGLPVLAMSRRRAQRFARVWCGGLLGLLKIVCGLGWRLEGDEHVPRGPAIIAAKHQSAWDTIVFHRLLDDPVFILKHELLRVPGLGWYLRAAGNIAVDRAAGPSAMRTLMPQVGQRLRDGAQVIVFPEGTRVAPGETQPYKAGIAGLWGRLDAPVVPVALNSGLFWGRRQFEKRPGRITIRFLPPLPTGLPRRELARRLEEAIEAATRALCGLKDGAAADAGRDGDTTPGSGDARITR
jgi:1-acyl-sn-glycerol-3-phosphate acyltransferase